MVSQFFFHASSPIIFDIAISILKLFLIEISRLWFSSSFLALKSHWYFFLSWYLYSAHWNSTFHLNVNNDSTLNKESTSYNDIFDVLRLAFKFYRFKDSSSWDFDLKRGNILRSWRIHESSQSIHLKQSSSLILCKRKNNNNTWEQLFLKDKV